MADTDGVWQVYAIRYAVNPGQRAAQNFIGGDPHDGPMPLDYFVWLIRSGERAILVDTGFDRAMADRRGRTHLACPAKTLARMGVDPEGIEDVILTHLHYDHAGNHHLFPQARFHVQDREMAYATGRAMVHGALRAPYEADDVAAMVHRIFAERVAFHDGSWELAPGIVCHRIGGHTDGLQAVQVRTARGRVVLASDASHFYANMETGRSFPLVYHLGDMLEGFHRLRELADGDDHVIPGHDPLVMARYPVPSPELAGMVARLDVPPIG
ncbi:hypothetical protein GCM10011380_35520 [Sphingomonas metalli]|uniref:Metallo-beta-lactamase domain-containing protein n=1 Tax=Sphingomonas metalli TaxID=1779358 RepID=A0A916TGE4_9SPHN|nr:N-acyl homoserine lactonase family protein [Sphingomonas metalli]GGB42932.1 hypothetical protein GCM10011380_35520 [Sphingomonas metalli]